MCIFKYRQHFAESNFQEMRKLLLPLLVLCPFVLILAQPSISGDADVRTNGAGDLTVTNCAWGGTTLWTDSGYVSVAWSTGDTGDTLYLDEFTSYDTVWVYVTDTSGGMDTNFVIVSGDTRANERMIFPSGFQEICEGDTLVIIAGMGVDGDEIMFNTGKFCIDSYSTLCDIKVDTPGVFWFERYRPSNGCTYVSEETEVALMTPPGPPSGITMSGDTLIAMGGGPVWQWYLDGAAISGASDPSYLPMDMGAYSVQSVDTTSTGSVCRSATTDTINVDVSIDRQIGGIWVKVFPNPADEWFTLRGFSSRATIKMYDTAGREAKCISARDGLNFIVNMEELPEGLYLISVEENDRKYYGKVWVR